MITRNVFVVLFASALTLTNVCAIETQDVWDLGSRISGLPSAVVYSIALTESGRKVNGAKQPYPWSLSINSNPPQSLRFNTRKEAEAHLNSLLKRGITNIDVGLMQVNLMYHGHSVRNPVDLLDPKLNVMVASVFLRELLNESQDIGKTIARYHSRTAPLGDNYKRLVFGQLVNFER